MAPASCGQVQAPPATREQDWNTASIRAPAGVGGSLRVAGPRARVRRGRRARHSHTRNANPFHLINPARPGGRPRAGDARSAQRPAGVPALSSE